MYMRLKKAVCIGLIIVLLAFVVIPPPSASALATEAVLVSAIYGLFSAWGINYIFTNMSVSDVQSNIITELNSYLSSVGETLSDWLNFDITGISGLLKVPGTLGSKIASFAVWLRAKYQLDSYGPDVIISSSNYYFISLYDGSYSKIGYRDNTGVQYFGDPLTLPVTFLSGASIKKINDNKLTLYQPDGVAQQSYNFNNSSVGDTFYIVRYLTTYFMMYSDADSSSIASDLLPNIDANRQLLGYIDLNQQASINPGALDIPASGDISSEDNIYIGQDIINPSATVDDIASGILADTAANDLSVSVEITDSDTPTIPVDPDDPINPDEMGVTGLSDVFPFCIPFDIIAAVDLLRATPETPVITIPFRIPSIDFRYDVVIDFDQWEPVIQVFRTMELLAFIVGLALVTRQIYLRS